MQKLRMALIAMTMATGLTFAAGDAEKPPVPPGDAPPAPRRADDFDPSQLPALLQWNERLIGQWEGQSGLLRTDEAKKVFAEGIALAKTYRAGLEQLSAAVEAGKEDEAARLTAQLRERRPDLAQYAATLPTYMELDQAKTLQAERGAGNADLNARCKRIIDLLNKRLDLQKQIGAVNRELFKQRQALQQSLQNPPGNAPAVEPPKPAPQPEPQPEPKPPTTPGAPA